MEQSRHDAANVGGRRALISLQLHEMDWVSL